MSPLPSGWKTSTLGEIADTQLGKMLNKSKQTGKSTVPYLRNLNVQWGRIDIHDLNSMDIALNERDKFTAKKGDLLVCEGGESGRSAIWQGDEPIGFQNALHRIRPRDGIETRFLFYYFEWIVKNRLIDHLFNGVTIKHFPQENLRKVRVSYPPLAEQRQIIEILEDHLSRLDAALADIKQARVKTVQFRRSFLNQAFKDCGIEETHLSAIARVIDCEHKTAPRADSGPYGYSLGTSSVREGVIDFQKAKPVSLATYREWTVRQVPLKGDLILTREAPIGEVALIPNEPPVCLGQRTVLIKINPERIDPEYLRLRLLSPQISTWMKAHATGTTVLHLNVADVKKIPLGNLPSLDIQRNQVLETQAAMEAISSVDKCLDQMELRQRGLRRSLLQAAFAGQLTQGKMHV